MPPSILKAMLHGAIFVRQLGGNHLNLVQKKHFSSTRDILLAVTHYPQENNEKTELVNIGLFCSTPGVALGRAVPRKLAMEMLFTGEPISAEVALKHGLVSKVVPEELLEEETNKITEKICQSSRSVIALGKATFNSQMMKHRVEAYEQAGDVMVHNLGMKDGQEGIQAFIQKRHPTWTNTLDLVDEK